MSADVVLSGAKHRQRNDAEREQRQKVNRAPGSPGSNRVDEERCQRDQNHEKRPGPADRSMRERSLGGQKLRGAETDRREGEKGMKPDNRRSVEQRREGHCSTLRAPVLD